jgi:hypothetical protein
MEASPPPQRTAVTNREIWHSACTCPGAVVQDAQPIRTRALTGAHAAGFERGDGCKPRSAGPAVSRHWRVDHKSVTRSPGDKPVRPAWVESFHPGKANFTAICNNRMGFTNSKRGEQ